MYGLEDAILSHGVSGDGVYFPLDSGVRICRLENSSRFDFEGDSLVATKSFEQGRFCATLHLLLVQLALASLE